MRLRQLVTLLPGVFLASTFVLAQNHYSSSGGPETIINNLNNCVTHNCLIMQNLVANSSSHASIVQAASGQDGYVLGIDPNNYVWTLPLATTARSAWTPVSSMGQVYGLAILDSSNIYSVGPSCGSDRLIQQWSSNGTWRSLGRCGRQIGIGGTVHLPLLPLPDNFGSRQTQLLPVPRGRISPGAAECGTGFMCITRIWRSY
jgi:hypothetical protein